MIKQLKGIQKGGLNIKKRYFLLIICLVLLVLLNIFKRPNVIYLPFNIPGNQMAATIPPMAIFIESKYKTEKKDEKCSLIKHEMIHWEQYRRMGLFSFYYNYLKLYFAKGRINNWMEEQARRPCQGK